MKTKKRLIYQLFPSYLLITLISLIAVSWYALSFTRTFFLERTQVDLEVNGRMLEKQMVRLLSPLNARAIDQLCKDAAGETVNRVTVILPDGPRGGGFRRNATTHAKPPGPRGNPRSLPGRGGRQCAV